MQKTPRLKSRELAKENGVRISFLDFRMKWRVDGYHPNKRFHVGCRKSNRILPRCRVRRETDNLVDCRRRRTKLRLSTSPLGNSCSLQVFSSSRTHQTKSVQKTVPYFESAQESCVSESCSNPSRLGSVLSFRKGIKKTTKLKSREISLSLNESSGDLNDITKVSYN